MSLGPPAGFRPVERKPVRTKVQQNEIPPERQPARKKTQQNEKPNLNRFTIDFVLKQSLLRLLTLPLRHNNNGKKNCQISTAPYGNNFTGVGAAKYYYFVTSYRLIHSRGRFSAGRRIYFVGRGDFSHGAAVFLTSHHPPAGDFPSPPATIGGGRICFMTPA